MSILLITDGNPRGLGYLEVDQRAVPAALPPGTVPHFEADTYTCSHCQRVVVLNLARVRERYKCKTCQHHVCDDCAARLTQGAPCRTWAQYVDEMLEQEARQLPTQSILLPWEVTKG